MEYHLYYLPDYRGYNSNIIDVFWTICSRKKCVTFTQNSEGYLLNINQAISSSPNEVRIS